MTKILKSEKDNFLNFMYVYEAAMEILKSQISIVKIEYSQLIRSQGYNEIQNEKYRIKEFDSIVGKLEKGSYEFSLKNIQDHIHDVVGARIVCLTLRDVECIKDLILNNKTFKIEKTKDYITNPKDSGYQSFHIRNIIPVVFSNNSYEIASEIQIRTVAMDAWALLEHKLAYKGNDLAVKNALVAQFNALASTCNSTDQLVDALTGNPTTHKQLKK